MTGRRDPEGRRQAIVHAAVEVIAEVGVGNVTHRRIADRAAVPLGSTTYYFPTLDDLVVAALNEVARAAEVELGRWARALGGCRTRRELADTVTDLAVRYLEDRSRVLLEYELYLAATRTPGLRAVALSWLDGLRRVLADQVVVDEPDRARALAALLDGVLLQALVTGEPLDADALRAGMAGLLAEPGPLRD